MYPQTKQLPVVNDYHGFKFDDPFQWLEGDLTDPANMGALTPEVAEWTDQQNAFTRSQLDSHPQRVDIERALRPLMEVGSVTAPIVRGGRWFFSKRDGSQDQPVFYWRDRVDGEDIVLIDPSQLDRSGLTTVEWIAPSHDGRLLAYGSYRAGNEDTTLHLIAVDTRTTMEAPITGKVEAPDWLPDGSGFIYRSLKDPKNPYSGQVCYHQIGQSAEADRVLFRQKTPDEDAVLATTWGPHASLSDDGRWLWLGYWTDTQSIDAWLVDFQKVRAGGSIDLLPVSIGVRGMISAHVEGDQLFMHTTKGAPNGRIVSASTAAPHEAGWTDLIPERADAVIDSVAYAKDRIVVTYLKSATTRIEVFLLTGASLGELTLPGLGSASVSTERDRTCAYVTFTSFNFPTTIFEFDLEHLDMEPSLWAAPDVPVDPASVVVEQVWYASPDGTRVSMFLVRPITVTPTGETPCIVTGYGGFNISETPTFVPSWFQWFDAGGMIAIPNLRGGGEYGDAWHEAGMREHKQNVFDDFFAAIEWLIAEGWTRPTRLAVSGGSNGGLLTGATVTQRPDLCRAAIVAVPLLDMLRYQHFLMARYWVPEYGSADDAAMFPFLYAYSPYHHVRIGPRYPAVFLTAGENDTRVHPMHARKMAAALQRASSTHSSPNRVLLWVDREAGHGQGKPLHLRLRDVVDQRLFLMAELGMLGV